ncbi:MAG: prephenate/arogenate dehydrogenase family protein, partial [Erythrobacter sp.]|nr:prephenate/arogenate dehydrogenase family protein [Erythrobacter sp.]
GEALHDLFTRTRAIRREVIDQGQDDERPDFGRGHGE